ncbi:hypothetical protein GJ496_004112 [Pomphorhynchus laevis]|nr:hypothetical protein GJ496_004112 [Pomphorhynchus laevis]
MTHIFDVLNGQTCVLDVELIVCSVSKLKLAIENAINIPSDKQILVISGGDVLNENQRPADQGCGSEENPIFLFALTRLQSDEDTSLDDKSVYINRTEKIDKKDMQKILNIRHSLEWLENCYCFVERVNDDISFLNKSTVNSLYEQRMQYQGWMAVVANLEDFCSCFRNIMDRLNRVYSDYCNKDQSFIFGEELFQNISKLNDYSFTDLHTLEFENLFKWIDNHIKTISDGCDLYTFIQQSQETLSKTDLSMVKVIVKESDLLFELIESGGDNKILIGIEERFRELQLICDETKALAYNSASHLMAVSSSLKKIKSDPKLSRDKRLLSDVCQVHQPAFGNIVDMLHESLSLWNRICFSKQELIKNIHSRLRWLVKVENEIGLLDGKARFYTAYMTSLINRIDLIKQIDTVPVVYPEILQELTRRKNFVDAYSNIRLKFLPIFENFLSNERQYRESFTTKFGDHFLSNLVNNIEENSQMDECTLEIEFDNELMHYNADSLKNLSSIEQCSDISKSTSSDATTETTELDILNEIISKICISEEVFSKSMVNQSLSYRQTTLPMYSCIRAGDLVCIKLGPSFNLQIITNTKTKYFLNKKCYNDLDITDEQLQDGFTFGYVIRIQCCSIKKEPNRFNIPINTRFFVVTCGKSREPTEDDDGCTYSTLVA